MEHSSRITVRRDRRVSGFAVHVAVDGVTVAKLRPGKAFTIDVEPGDHVVKVPRGGFIKPLSVHVDPGEGVLVELYKAFWMAKLRVAPGTETKTPRSGLKALPKAVDPPGGSGGAVPQATRKGTDQAGDHSAVLGTPLVRATGRREVTLGEPEVRLIDNAEGLSPIVRTFRVAREWSRSWSVDLERLMEISTTIGIPFTSIRAEIERTLQRNYSQLSQERQTFEDSVVVTVAPRTLTVVTFTWHEVRQQGVVDIDIGDRNLSVPYDCVVGVTFDQRQVDKK
jgi:hypothetical protein